MSKKETLIEMLRGSVAELHKLVLDFDEVDIFDHTGHVDIDFFTTMLEMVAAFTSASNDIIRKFNELLAPDAEDCNKPVREKDSGAVLSPEDILKKCELKDNILYLPKVQFAKKTYLEVKKRVEDAGGKWSGGKVQGFTFDFNAERVFSLLKEGGRVNLAQEFQFFETPAEVADWLVSLAGAIGKDKRILEPSAGRGAIVKAIHRACPEAIVDCYELMPENREILAAVKGARLIGEDFTKAAVMKYDFILANPPFSGNQDIRHVMRMYDCLLKGGTLAAITSRHWQFAQEKVCTDFRTWLDAVGGRVFEIEENAFRNSGTGIGTMAVVITK